MKVLVKKTFLFVNDVLRAYIRWKITDLSYVVSGCLIQLHIVCNYRSLLSLSLPSLLLNKEKNSN